MEKTPETGTPSRKRWPAALVATGLLAGGAAVGVVGVAAATAAPQLTSASPSPSASSSTDAEKRHRGGETEVTGTKATTLKAAALKAVPGATVLRVETDADGAAYEVHLRKADGTRVTVEFDAALKQTAVETDTGRGGGHGPGGRGDETEVTGATATALKAAALKAVPGGTVERVETDSDGAAYEVHVTKADGTHVTVKFDAALKQTALETGPGKGGGRGGDHRPDAGGSGE